MLKYTGVSCSVFRLLWLLYSKFDYYQIAKCIYMYLWTTFSWMYSIFSCFKDIILEPVLEEGPPAAQEVGEVIKINHSGTTLDSTINTLYWRGAVTKLSPPQFHAFLSRYIKLRCKAFRKEKFVQIWSQLSY